MFGHGVCIILSRKYFDLIMFDVVVDLITFDDWCGDDDDEISTVRESSSLKMFENSLLVLFDESLVEIIGWKYF